MSELISQSPRSLVFKDIEIDTGEILVWKTTGSGSNSISELANEYEVTSQLLIEGIRTAHGKGIYQNKEAYSYRHIPGTGLETLYQRQPPSLEQTLTIVLKILHILKQLHQAGVCHLRINPQNILYDPQSEQVHIIDFSVATRDGVSIRSFENWGGELAYLAPELAQKTEQKSDSRSDLYSLGLVMYWMVTGLNPFYNDDKSQLIHKVLVKVPAPASEVNPNIPQALANAIGKLIAKNPKDRYQTAHGLEHDVNAILQNLSTPEWDGKMKLGTQDYSDKLYLSESLYGRESEMKLLKTLFTITEQAGESQVCLISGKAGVGKSSLIEHFAKHVGRKNGLFLTGKFQRLDSNLPHQAMVMALNGLATHILAQQDSTLEYWKQTIGKATQGLEDTLIDLSPEFSHIINEVPNTPATSSSQIESRINFLFQQIIKYTASPAAPLVLFFDDLQWADEASLKSLQTLISNRYTPHFMFVGAYNVNEISDQPLEEQLPDIMEERPDIRIIELQNITVGDVKMWLKDSFTTEDPDRFAELVYRKTLGAPFFIKAILNQLLEKGILTYQPSRHIWLWDAQQIEELQVSESVIEYINDQFLSLSDSEKDLLRNAAVVGKTFSIPVLKCLYHSSNGDLLNKLAQFQNADFIQKTGDMQFSFMHDRIHQTAYQLSPEDELPALHYTVAQFLKENITKSNSLARAFEISRHFRMATEYETAEDTKYLIKLYTQLGNESQKNASFQAAYEYFKDAISRIDSENWNSKYTETLDLYYQAAEVGMITGNRTQAEEWLKLALEKAKNIEDRVRAHEIKLNHLCETHLFAEAIDYLLIALDEIGYGIKRHPGKLTILREYLGVQWQLRNTSIDDIPKLPLMKDARAKAFVKLTVMATVSIYGWATDILPIVFFRQVKLSLKYGNSQYSAYSYSAFGFALIAFMGNLNRGFKFGKTALEVARQMNAHVIKTKVNVVFYAFLSFWKDSLITSLPHLEDAYIAGRQTGDLFYASFALHFQSSIKLQAGRPLGKLSQTTLEDGLTLKKMGQEMVHFTFEIQRAYINSLYGYTTDLLILKSPEYEQETISKMESLDDQATVFEFYYYKMALAFVYNQYDKALEYGRTASSFEDETTPWQITYPNFLLIYTLTLIQSLKKSPNGKTEKLVKQKLKLLQRITKEAPQNYSNKYELAMAVYHAYHKKYSQAHTCFIKSIEAARWTGFVHEEALAREHFAYFLIETNQSEFVESMVRRAFECYKQWQAYSKCEMLKKEFPDVIKSPVRRPEGIASYQNIYDLNTIIKANQALSSENSLNGLLNTMTEMMINNASVDYIVVALKGNSLELQPMAYSGRHINNDDENLYPNTLANVVARTQNTLVSGNLSQDTKYNFDPYIKAQSPISACCMPVINKGELLGVIYLENNLSENAFDSARIEFFQTIAAQLAISLDSVLLYSKLENKVKERTQELVQKNDELASQKKKSDDLLLNILPYETAEELKIFGKTSAKSYDSVTVMFIDIKNFSGIAENMPAEELVAELDFCFKKFDAICADYNLEKIKTIGDAYMAAGGIPENNRATPQDVVNAAMAMRDFTIETAENRSKIGESFFEIRVGIHTGPVVAGVVGSKKFQYDIWGNTVNLAARMEQNSEAGRINISHATYNFVKDHFKCMPRGKISAKNIGEVDMYFIENS